MIKRRLIAFLILIAGLAVAFFVYSSESGLNANASGKLDFKLGLDLSGGTHLVYKADVAEIPESEIKDSMESLRDVIERRVNLFGVAETKVQTQEVTIAGLNENRLVVDLPGVTDINQAVEMIGQTPLLEFKLASSGAEDPLDLEGYYTSTGLTGKYLDRASLEFTQSGGGQGGLGGQPIIALQFNKEGGDMFEEITGDNIGEILAIFLDGAPISTPVIQSSISGGQATITGNFTPDEAKQLVGRLNSGALPVPIELISTQTIGATLGSDAIDAGLFAGMVGFLILSVLFILWYRLPGVIAIVALGFYMAIMFALFKLVPVTLTAAGIAGFIISLGIAVDANILIFERMKEEIKGGRSTFDGLKEGFSRAWLSIRDSNVSSLITAVILFWFGSSLIKGFALTFGLGVLVSMISAITITRFLLYAFTSTRDGKIRRLLFGTGFNK
ncbi:MAG: preprotein translocase subunit SecD [Candidatus Paceibacteria bacterium]|jgi:preprotein translocase subunit SecD